MKTWILFGFALIVSAAADAQQFEKGSQAVSVGAGIGSALGSFSYGSQTPALSLQYERGIWDIGGPGVISLGGYVGTKRFRYAGGGYTDKWNYTILGVRSAYHYNGLHVEKLDIYGGVMLSYNILHYSYKTSAGTAYSGSGSYGSTAGFSLYAGGRYFFTSSLGAFAELGYGVSYLTLGLVLRF